ncbi:MAG: superoxide dismutase [Anaerolineae bacterium]
MAYTAMDFGYLKGLDGLSDDLIKNHLMLYQGYVNNTNKLLDIYDRLVSAGQADSLEHQETRRHLGFEFNGMRLHEFYFRNLGGDGNPDQGADLKRMLEASYGSLDNWKRRFVSIGMTRGIGWTILYQDGTNGQLIDFWIDEHHIGHPAGCQPILVMDCWEHAYMLDYGLKRADYISAFFRNVNWQVCQARMNMEPARQAA